MPRFSASCAVAGDLGSLAGRFLYELCAEILALIEQIDLLSYCYAVLCDRRAAPALVENGVSAPWAEGWFDGCGELLDACEQACPCVSFKCQFFHCHNCLPP